MQVNFNKEVRMCIQSHGGVILNDSIILFYIFLYFSILFKSCLNYITVRLYFHLVLPKIIIFMPSNISISKIDNLEYLHYLLKKDNLFNTETQKRPRTENMFGAYLLLPLRK